MTIEEIPEVVRLMNEGGAHPEGVCAVGINRRTNVYSHIYFPGIGLYIVDQSTPTLMLTEEEVQQELSINYEP